MPWQTISTDSLNSLLLQGGSQTGSIKAANMAWSTLLGGQNLAPIVTSVQLTTQGSLATQNVVGWGPGPAYNATGHYTGTAYAGVDQTGTVQCQSCSFAALTAGVTRNLDLQSNYGAVALDEHWNATATAGIQTN
jgi:hypothetical protein